MSVSVEDFIFTDGSKVTIARMEEFDRVFALSRNPIKGLDYEVPAQITDLMVVDYHDPSLKVIDVAKHVEALRENDDESCRRRYWKEILDGKQDLHLSSFTFSNGVTVPVVRGNHRIAYVKTVHIRKAHLEGWDYKNKVSKSDGERLNVHALYGKSAGRSGLILHVENLVALYGAKCPILKELLLEQEEVLLPMPRKRIHESQSQEEAPKRKTSKKKDIIDTLIETTVQEQIKAAFQTQEVQDAIKERILKALK